MNFPITSHSTRHHTRNVAVVSSHVLVRNCHLIPKWGPDATGIPPDWSEGHNVLDENTDFYLNRYYDFHMFLSFHRTQLLPQPHEPDGQVGPSVTQRQ